MARKRWTLPFGVSPARRGILVSEDEQRLAYEEIAKLAGEDGAIFACSI